MSVLVTGGAGFIGSAFVRLMVLQGERVVNVDKMTYAADPRALAGLSRSAAYRLEKVDICNHKDVREVLSAQTPRAVVHLAAESHVDRSIASPQAFIETNVAGTFSLLNATLEHWRERGRPQDFRFVHVSTDEVFGAAKPGEVRDERAAFAPNSPYAASKAASDHLVRAWSVTYGLPVIIVHCTNNYGLFQYPEKLIPVVIRNAVSGREIPIYGEGTAARDWVFVEDTATALKLVLENGVVGQSYNIGSQSEVRNIDLVRRICSVLDARRPMGAPHERLIRFVKDRPGHDIRYGIDSRKIRQELGWTPQTRLDDGLAGTVDWYLDHFPDWQVNDGG